MADVRVTTGGYTRIPGVPVGVQYNVFGMQRLQAGVNGEALAQIALKAGQPAYRDAYDGWAVLTGASRDSIALDVVEVTARTARIVLQAGGQRLINDPRNKSKKDYAPYLEFNGSPSGSQPAGLLVHSFFSNDREMRSIIHQGVTDLIRSLVG